MNYLKLFLDYANYMTDRAIYIWGGQSQVISRGKVYRTDDLSKVISSDAHAWIKAKETTSANATRAIRLYDQRVADGVDPIPCVDCSGFVTNFLYNKYKLLGTDKNANGLKGLCKGIAKQNLRVGDFVFKVNSSGRATHVGVMMSNDTTVESKGRDYGVVQLPLSKGSWNYFGRGPWWSDEDVKEIIGDDPYVFTRVLKWGRRGDDVCELKKLLQSKGYGLKLHTDNKNYLSSTMAEVKRYQKAMGLEVDGKAGPITIRSLGGKYV